MAEHPHNNLPPQPLAFAQYLLGMQPQPPVRPQDAAVAYLQHAMNNGFNPANNVAPLAVPPAAPIVHPNAPQFRVNGPRRQRNSAEDEEGVSSLAKLRAHMHKLTTSPRVSGGYSAAMVAW